MGKKNLVLNVPLDGIISWYASVCLKGWKAEKWDIIDSHEEDYKDVRFSLVSEEEEKKE
jgi:hypothetical protein